MTTGKRHKFLTMAALLTYLLLVMGTSLGHVHELTHSDDVEISADLHCVACDFHTACITTEIVVLQEPLSHVSAILFGCVTEPQRNLTRYFSLRAPPFLA